MISDEKIATGVGLICENKHTCLSTNVINDGEVFSEQNVIVMVVGAVLCVLFICITFCIVVSLITKAYQKVHANSKSPPKNLLKKILDLFDFFKKR